MSEPLSYEASRFISYENRVTAHAMAAFDERRISPKTDTPDWFNKSYLAGLVIAANRTPALLAATIEKYYPILVGGFDRVPKVIDHFGLQNGYELLDHLYRDERALFELRVVEPASSSPDRSLAITANIFSAMADCHNFIRCFRANGYFGDDFRSVRETVEDSLDNNGLLEVWSLRTTNRTRLELELFPTNSTRPPDRRNNPGLEPQA